MSQIRLPLPSFQYRFDLLLDFVKRIAYPARMIAVDDLLWRYTAGKPLAYEQADNSIVISGDSLDRGGEAELRKASAHILGLDRDLSAFYDFARRDAPLWSVVEPLVGLPLFRTETAFEALITLIIEQHISWKTALRSQRTLMQQFGKGGGPECQKVYDFPAPASVAGASVQQLRALKITNRRSALIIDIARRVTDGELELERSGSLDLAAVYEQLMSIKGIGSWTAGNVIGRAFGRFPQVSQNDVALQAAVNHYFCADDEAKGAAQVSDTLGRYGEFAGLAGHFVLLRWVFDRYPPVSS